MVTDLQGEDDLPEEDDAEVTHFELRVDKGQELVRIDRFLVAKTANSSRNKIQQAIDADVVKVNGLTVKSNYKVKPGDLITYWIARTPRPSEVLPEPIVLDIVYEDDHLLVVNKPAGMVVHPAHGNWSGTLVNGLAYYFNQLPELPGNTGRPGLVHRIDKDTSGLLVVAKSERAMSHLAEQFFVHSIERTYLALVWGEPAEDRGTIDVPIGRSAKDRKVMDAYPDGSSGKRAVTHWEVVKRLRYVSLLACKLETGRTHQIRIHMKYAGHPLFNDSPYGGDKIRKGTQFSKYKAFVQNCFKILPRQALHARSLGFVHPVSGEKMFFEAPIPRDMSEAIDKWEEYVNQMS
ncbi:Ribosomal large subunit pseudouridine synthase D [Lunatimonas lonarensis]|uniref:Pseudouridine synthase n=1 Tax=Lunatimonas lonarensis TaxID=1232681 RepID=R7ZNM7_9BACT|nr:RluA family pseudouridine synthase [Lunatimonas lonarensis]EON75682.1 Ribosomal large subunit pseudouridine synthase D [Lunatimonas lonarensis]